MIMNAPQSTPSRIAATLLFILSAGF